MGRCIHHKSFNFQYFKLLNKEKQDFEKVLQSDLRTQCVERLEQNRKNP